MKVSKINSHPYNQGEAVLMTNLPGSSKKVRSLCAGRSNENIFFYTHVQLYGNYKICVLLMQIFIPEYALLFYHVFSFSLYRLEFWIRPTILTLMKKLEYYLKKAKIQVCTK